MWSFGRMSVRGLPEGRLSGWKNGRPSGVSISKFQSSLPSRSKRTPVGVVSSFDRRKEAIASSVRRHFGSRAISSSMRRPIAQPG